MRSQQRRLSISHLALLIPWVVLVIDAWDPLMDNSFLWHVRSGTVQTDLGSVLRTDPFSYTMLGDSWLTQSWLAELLYGWLEGVTGLAYVPVMILLTGLLTFIAIGLVAFRRSRSTTATAFILVLSSLALISFLVPRPVLFSYLLMTLAVLAWDRSSTRWTLPFLFWVWAAVHASFVIGLAYIGLSMIMERAWREFPKVFMSGVAALLTAHGIGVVGFLLDFGGTSDALKYLTEWRRPGLLDPVLLPFLGGLVFIVIGAYRDRIYPNHLWVVIPFTVLGFSAVRAIPPAWLGLVPIVAVSLSGLHLGSRSGLRSHLAAVFLIVVLGLPFLLIDDGELSEERFPVSALLALDDSNAFHDDVIGGFLIWAEGPERKVYIDDRAELYGDRMAEFVMVRTGQAPWEPVFERDDIGQVLLQSDEYLVSELRQAGWTTVHEDEAFTVLRTRASG